VTTKNTGLIQKTFGLTKFADLTQEEFAEILKAKVDVNAHGGKIVSSAAPPATPIDWLSKGKVTPMKNQGQCGSGFILAVVETVESANLVLGKNMTIGSVDEIYDCSANDGGCNGGDPFTAFRWVASQGGLESAECYGPPDPSQGCKEAKCADNPDPNLMFSGIVPVAKTDDALYGALTKAPVFVCVDASSWQDYTGGILQASQCGQNIDHCVQVTGYSPKQGGYWILKNSWGTSWGMQGFIWLQYGLNTCGITSTAVLGKV